MSVAEPLKRAKHRYPRSRLVIAESGSPRALLDGAGEFDQTVSIQQLEHETSADFAERAMQRISLALASRQYFTCATLLVGPGYDQLTCSARRLVSLAIADYADSTRTMSELVAVVPADAHPEVRASVLELADDLVLSATRTPLSVRILFLEPDATPAAGGLRLARCRPREARDRPHVVAPRGATTLDGAARKRDHRSE